MTREAEAAVRTLLGELARSQALRVQAPGADVIAIAREAQQAAAALQWVAETLNRDIEVEPK